MPLGTGPQSGVQAAPIQPQESGIGGSSGRVGEVTDSPADIRLRDPQRPRSVRSNVCCRPRLTHCGRKPAHRSPQRMPCSGRVQVLLLSRSRRRRPSVTAGRVPCGQGGPRPPPDVRRQRRHRGGAPGTGDRASPPRGGPIGADAVLPTSAVEARSSAAMRRFRADSDIHPAARYPPGYLTSPLEPPYARQQDTPGGI